MNDNLRDLITNDQYLYNGNGFTQKLPTGIITLDIALGGGIPLNGALIEIWGAESSGKTTLTYRACKRCTDLEDGYVTWVDSEGSYDTSWATVQGLDTSKVIVYRPPYMEAANGVILDDIRKYKEKYLPWLVDPKWKPSSDDANRAGLGITNIEGIKKYMIDAAPVHVIAWDSIAASPVKSVAESGSEFAEGMAFRARLIKSFLTRYQVAVIGCDKVCLILLNQVITSLDMYAPPETTAGGMGLKHMKHLSIYVKKQGRGEQDQDQFTVTDYVKLAITKNKVTPVIASFPVIFSKSKGYIGATSLLEYLMNINWFRSAGSWKKFTYRHLDKDTGEVKEEEVSIQRGTFYKMIEDRPEIFEYLCNEIKEMYVSKFPFSHSLIDSSVSDIIKACLEEESAIPNEEEAESTEELLEN